MPKRKPLGCTYFEQIAYEVQWYEEHGKYPERIKTDSLHRRYVEWDRGWNKRNPYRRETIAGKLRNYVQRQVTGI